MNDIPSGYLLVLQPDVGAAIDANFFQPPDSPSWKIQTNNAARSLDVGAETERYKPFY
jgi:hypothetical protein